MNALSPTIGLEVAEAPRLREVTKRAADFDARTYRAVKAELEAGGDVSRDFRTGHVIPAHLSGKLYSARDLFASAMAELDLASERASARLALALKIAAE